MQRAPIDYPVDLPIYIAPTIKIRPRSAVVEEAAQSLEYTPLQSRIISGRLAEQQAVSLQRQIRPQMSELDGPDSLPDIGKAVERLTRAVVDRQPILVCTDHDADGVSGHCVVRTALMDNFAHPPELTHSFISHRMKEGYGISEGVVDRILAAGHDRGVLLSVDQGSSDEPRIARLADAGIDTVVTDHHGVEGSGPPSAYACVNPVREDSRFPDKFVAGCHVAWLTMAAVRRELIRIGRLPDDTPHLHDTLPFVALGTTADCVSFSRSRNNRLIVQRGLHRINHRPDPCWQALREIRKLDGPMTSSTLGFLAGPMVNAQGRVDEAMVGVRFLLSVSLAEARKYAGLLNAANEERKEIQEAMRLLAMDEASRQVARGAAGLAVWLEAGHSGVHGVVASRLVEAFGRPTMCISPKQGKPGIVTASARAVPGFHVRNAFAFIDESYPGALLAWGGHEGAGGLTAREADIPAIQALWDQAVIDSGVDVGPVLMTDGPLPGPPDFAMITEIECLQPYGREFDAPVFSQEMKLVEARPVGQGNKHVKLTVELAGRLIDGIWFNVPSIPWSIEPGMRVRGVFELDTNTFRGETKLQLLIRHIEPV